MNSINTTDDLNNNTKENKVFNAIYAHIDNEIPFDLEWNNGTGYMDGVCYSVKLAPGKLAKSISGSRKLIMIGTMFGTAVLFERYNNGENGVIVCNVPGEIRQLHLSDIPTGRLGSEQIQNLFGASYRTDTDTVSVYKYGALPSRLEMMLDVFSGEYARRKQARLENFNAKA